ncbi:MAG: hypothetical protein K5918_08325, partial [Bacteroidales bacterium]|nr:hypothetical protein [Bacteroidales bacterium]
VFFGRCPVVVRSLSARCPVSDWTTSGQRADNNWTTSSVGTVVERRRRLAFRAVRRPVFRAVPERLFFFGCRQWHSGCRKCSENAANFFSLHNGCRIAIFFVNLQQRFYGLNPFNALIITL